MNNLGVVVVHMQEDYKPHLQNTSNDIRTGLESILAVLTVAMNNQSPIVIAEMSYKGNVLPEISSILQPDKFEVSYGEYRDCFQDSGLAKALRDRGITRLVLAGYDKYCCVLATARGAIKHKFQLSTAEDLLFFTEATTSDQDRVEGDSFYRSKCKWYESVDQLIAGEWGEQK